MIMANDFSQDNKEYSVKFLNNFLNSIQLGRTTCDSQSLKSLEM